MNTTILILKIIFIILIITFNYMCKIMIKNGAKDVINLALIIDTIFLVLITTLY